MRGLRGKGARLRWTRLGRVDGSVDPEQELDGASPPHKPCLTQGLGGRSGAEPEGRQTSGGLISDGNETSGPSPKCQDDGEAESRRHDR